MAILLAYERLDDGQRTEIERSLEPYAERVSQLSFHRGSVQLVLNDNEIDKESGQAVIDILVDVLKPRCWGTDLPIRFPRRTNPPEVYARYDMKVPYDPSLV